MKRNNCLLILCFMLSLPAFGWAGDLKLNEICVLPVPGKAQWIELLNTSNSFIKAADYKLETDQGDIVFAQESGSIASGGVMLIVLDGLTGVRHDGKTMLVHVPNKNMLTHPKGFVTLKRLVATVNEKTKTAQPQWQTMDTVAWGGDSALDVGSSPGGALGLLPGSRWMNYLAPDITPGSLNKKIFYPPQMLKPAHDFQGQGCPVFSWTTLSPQTLVQFSEQEDFSKVIARVVVTEAQLTQCPKAIKANKIYFWRLRAQDEQGHVSGWTKPWRFTLTGQGK